MQNVLFTFGLCQSLHHAKGVMYTSTITFFFKTWCKIPVITSKIIQISLTFNLVFFGSSFDLVTSEIYNFEFWIHFFHFSYPIWNDIPTWTYLISHQYVQGKKRRQWSHIILQLFTLVVFHGMEWCKVGEATTSRYEDITKTLDQVIITEQHSWYSIILLLVCFDFFAFLFHPSHSRNFLQSLIYFL